MVQSFLSLFIENSSDHFALHIQKLQLHYGFGTDSKAKNRPILDGVRVAILQKIPLFHEFLICSSDAITNDRQPGINPVSK